MQIKKETFEQRAEILKNHIKDDTKWFADPFLGDFMKGRVEIEELWLEECEKLSKGTTEGLLTTLESRRAMLKTYIAEKKNKYKTIDGQKMRGGVAVLTHWLEETECLIACIER